MFFFPSILVSSTFFKVKSSREHVQQRQKVSSYLSLGNIQVDSGEKVFACHKVQCLSCVNCLDFPLQLFAIIVFGSVSSSGWFFFADKKAEVCVMNMDSSACHYSTFVGIIAFIASIGFIVGEWWVLICSLTSRIILVSILYPMVEHYIYSLLPDGKGRNSEIKVF